MVPGDFVSKRLWLQIDVHRADWQARGELLPQSEPLSKPDPGSGRVAVCPEPGRARAEISGHSVAAGSAADGSNPVPVVGGSQGIQLDLRQTKQGKKSWSQVTPRWIHPGSHNRFAGPGYEPRTPKNGFRAGLWASCSDVNVVGLNVNLALM